MPNLDDSPYPAEAAARSLIQISHDGMVFSGDKKIVTTLSTAFRENNHVVLPSLFSPSFLKTINARLDNATYKTNLYPTGGKKDAFVYEKVTHSPIAEAIHWVLNDQRFISVIKDLTGNDQLFRFDGRLYVMEPDQGHNLGWHKDLDGVRKVAFSVNLTPRSFEGGQLLLREVNSRQHTTIHNTGPGDAVLFKISERLEHRVLPVSGSQKKIAFAGWFFDPPSA